MANEIKWNFYKDDEPQLGGLDEATFVQMVL